MEEPRFGLGVFVCVFNRDFSKILLVKRNAEKVKSHGFEWGNIGGKMEFGETILEGCRREAREEIGIDLKPENMRLIFIKETPKGFYNTKIHAIHFVYATVLDEDEKITLNDESTDYKWFSLDKLPAGTIDSKETLNDFADLAKKEFG